MQGFFAYKISFLCLSQLISRISFQSYLFNSTSSHLELSHFSFFTTSMRCFPCLFRSVSFSLLLYPSVGFAVYLFLLTFLFYQNCSVSRDSTAGSLRNLYSLFLDASTHLYKRVCPFVGPYVTQFFSMSRLWEKMVGNDWENSLKAPNSSISLPNFPKMSQNVSKWPKMSRNV